MEVAEPLLGLMEVAVTASGAVCWQPTGLMEADVPPLGLYNLQIFCGRQDSVYLFAFLPDGNFQFC